MGGLLSKERVLVRVWMARWARRWVSLVAMLVVVLAGLFRWGGDSSGLVELLRYVPYPVWLAPVVLAVVLACWLGWVWRAVAAGALALVLGPVMGLSLGLGQASAGEAAGQQPVRMMTYNVKSYDAVWRDKGLTLFSDEIARQAPDILVMQDAEQWVERGKVAPSVASVLGAFRLTQTSAQDEYVIASRFPLRGCRSGQIPRGNRTHATLQCEVQVGQRWVTVFTVHTLTPRRGLNAARADKLEGLDDWRLNYGMRLQQARSLADMAAQLPRPLILAGDLNAPEHSPVIQALLGVDLRDAFGEGGVGWGYTLGHALRPGISFLRLDHILVSADIGIARAWAGGKQASEHRPVVADLLVPR